MNIRYGVVRGKLVPVQRKQARVRAQASLRAILTLPWQLEPWQLAGNPSGAGASGTPLAPSQPEVVVPGCAQTEMFLQPDEFTLLRFLESSSACQQPSRNTC